MPLEWRELDERREHSRKRADREAFVLIVLMAVCVASSFDIGFWGLAAFAVCLFGWCVWVDRRNG